jgi:hypothetical protein
MPPKNDPGMPGSRLALGTTRAARLPADRGGGGAARAVASRKSLIKKGLQATPRIIRAPGPRTNSDLPGVPAMAGAAADQTAGHRHLGRTCLPSNQGRYQDPPPAMNLSSSARDG